MAATTDIASPRDGLLLERPGVKSVDTRFVDWEPAPDGKLYKTLERDEFGYPCIFLMFIPPGGPGAGRSDAGLPFRHYHANAYEHSFMLAGELPHAEYESAEQHNAQVYIKRAGVFMSRKPGSIHGAEKGIRSRTGAVLLYWRSPGGGTNTGEDNYDERSPHIPIDFSKRVGEGYEIVGPAPDGVIFDRPDFTALDTTLMDWESGPGLPEAYCKVLERDDDGRPSVMIVYDPPGEMAERLRPQRPKLPFRHYHRSVSERSFVLEGEAPHWEYESAEQKRGTMVLKQPGTYTARKPGSIHGLEEGFESRTGCTLLYWRTGGGGTFVEEDDYREQSVGVPF
jgi:hypothetical protein